MCTIRVDRAMTLGESCSFSVAFWNSYKFTGKERDAESGLDYFGARHYASTMGRFISPDRYNVTLTRQGLEAGGLPPEAADAFLNGYAANPQNWNQYAYVRNNPLNFVDPTGAAAIPGGDGASSDPSGHRANSNQPYCTRLR